MGERFISLIAVSVFNAARFIAIAIAIVFGLTTVHAQTFTVPKNQTQSQPAPIVSNKKKPITPVDWKKIPEAERKVLAPLEKDWTQLPGVAQRKLIGAAKTYPKLLPIQQERFQERIKDWASLTPEQRRSARDKFQDLSSLPPQKQHELRERWKEKSEKAQQATSAPATAGADTTAK